MSLNSHKNIGFECSLPLSQYDVITMGHGGGGKLSQDLINHILLPAFNNEYLSQQHDSTALTLPHNHIAVTTDSYVVDPIFFPGGNIGELAIIGTINDLAMRGANPLYITCSLILTEGLKIATLIKIVDEIRRAAQTNGIKIIAGDTKVVDKTNTPGLYINTTGIGCIKDNLNISPQSIQPNDAIIISHDIGRHGLAVLSAREKLDLSPPITTDCRALWPMVNAVLDNKLELHCLRDLTRGGLAAALIEIAQTANLCLEIEDNQIPIQQAVHAGCELLGLDPLYVANEGCMILFAPQEQAQSIVTLLQQFSNGNYAKQIGKVSNTTSARVVLNTAFGSKRQLRLFSGEQLPRIC